MLDIFLNFVLYVSICSELYFVRGGGGFFFILFLQTQLKVIVLGTIGWP